MSTSITKRDIIPILMIIASIWAVFGFLGPHYNTIKALRAEKKQYEDTLEKANEATRIMRESLLAEYNSVGPEDWKRLEKMLPSEPKGIQLARDVNGLAAIFGIKLSSFSFTEGSVESSAAGGMPSGTAMPTDDFGDDMQGIPQDVQIPFEPPPESRKLQLSFDFETSYPDFMRFLRELERSLELSDVRSLSVSRSGGGEEGTPNMYGINLSVDTYWIQ